MKSVVGLKAAPCTDCMRQLKEKAEGAKEKLHAKLLEERGEADAIQVVLSYEHVSIH